MSSILIRIAMFEYDKVYRAVFFHMGKEYTFTHPQLGVVQNYIEQWLKLHKFDFLRIEKGVVKWEEI